MNKYDGRTTNFNPEFRSGFQAPRERIPVGTMNCPKKVEYLGGPDKGLAETG
jgi:hypothetical protein